MPSPGQVGSILAEVSRTRPELVAFFACLYYAALRPEEAVALRGGDCALPPRGWGTLILTTACPRTGSAWTATGTPHEPRGLKHSPDGAIRIVPIPPALVTHLRQHLDRYGTTPDGRLFRGARAEALGPDLAATGLARRPYDLRHAALTLWLNATAAPPRSPPGPGTAPTSCTACTCTASTATTSTPTSRSRTPSAQTVRSLMVTAGGPPARRRACGLSAMRP